MKRFNLRGNSANWEALKVSALNTKTEQNESRSEIPYGHKITVRVVNNFYRLYDKRVRQILHGEISTEDNAFILARLTKARRPDFILFHDGKVIGIANIHRCRWYRREQEMPKTFSVNATINCVANVEARNEEEAKALVEAAINGANEVSEAENITRFEVVDIYAERV